MSFLPSVIKKQGILELFNLKNFETLEKQICFDFESKNACTKDTDTVIEVCTRTTEIVREEVDSTEETVKEKVDNFPRISRSRLRLPR